MKKFSMLLAFLSLTFVLAACSVETAPFPSPPPLENTPSEPAYDDSGTEMNDDEPSIPETTLESEDAIDDSNLPDDAVVEDDDQSSEDSSAPTDTEDDEDGMLELTLSQLSQFDGRDGRRAYIAVDGIIYDVTNSPRWAGGIHNGNSNISAGNDLTQQLNSNFRHGREVLANIPVVGRLVDDNE